MKKLYKEILFEKGYIVAESGKSEENVFEVLFSMASIFNIRITEGEKLAQKDMVPFIGKQLGEYVPEPFYRGFPQSVRELSTDRLLFDQLFHYLKTYGLGMFDEAGHSVFEDIVQRTAFREDVPVRELAIVTEERARELITETVNNLLLSSRPLSDEKYSLVMEYVRDHGGGGIKNCASKNTAVKLLADTRDMGFVRFLSMSDVIKLVDEINYTGYGSTNVKKLNLRNRDRKFITAVINALFDRHACDTKTCCEKKAVWCGLLHHLHYKPRGEFAESFVNLMRGSENISVYSDFEKAMSEKDVGRAARILREGKSPAAVLRSLNYLISQCSTHEQVGRVLDSIECDNVIVLLQLLIEYSGSRDKNAPRDFKFTAHNKLRVHHETDEEQKRRKSNIPDGYSEVIRGRIRELLKASLKGRLGKVYIDKDMRLIALPLQETTSQGGLGVLPRGSRLPIKDGKKIRAFTYWEKVNDIDLSVIGIDAEGSQTEFSWRTMAGSQSEAITYSGDQTSGYNGGSEYFDVDLERFKVLYPKIKYLVFCDNVFSGTNFDKCFCKAGYMVREKLDSGEVYEPKTVQSSFLVNCASTFAYLFGIDLKKNQFVWLNTARESRRIVAGTTSMNFLTKYFDVTEAVNMYTFFRMLASEVVDDPAEAEVIVSDKAEDRIEGAEIIRSCDFDKVLALMNKPAE